ncbi:MAG: low molecular weight phosphotyrosine protein phosphatase [Alphaproteobacteria bacterium]|nr:low molecular weight phosphotyrosine protein phosphatase [Alphaproteobacteria bacterium]MCB9691940.1 low molecular weight phosphotyrosine protein phosphatase [Alphaproteobacteria bacterium]
MKSVLFVCLGNICRSPMADAIAAHMARQRGLDLRVDSAGTGAWHAGEAADRRTLAVLRAHGIPYDGRARQVRVSDFAEFDLILAMDRSNLRDLLAICPPANRDRVHLVLEPLGEGLEVGDPYYGGPDGFEVVYRQLTEALEHWLA